MEALLPYVLAVVAGAVGLRWLVVAIEALGPQD